MTTSDVPVPSTGSIETPSPEAPIPQPSLDELMMLVQAARGAGASVLLALAFTRRDRDAAG